MQTYTVLQSVSICFQQPLEANATPLIHLRLNAYDVLRMFCLLTYLLI